MTILEVILTVAVIVASGASFFTALGQTSLTNARVLRIHSVTVAAANAAEQLQASGVVVPNSTQEVDGLTCQVIEQEMAGGNGNVEQIQATLGSISQTLWILLD